MVAELGGKYMASSGPERGGLQVVLPVGVGLRVMDVGEEGCLVGEEVGLDVWWIEELRPQMLGLLSPCSRLLTLRGQTVEERPSSPFQATRYWPPGRM